MRKKPDIPPRICPICNQKYKPNGTGQVYCKECGVIRTREYKRDWERKKHGYRPRTKSTDVCCVCGKGPERVVHFEGKPYCNKHYLRMKKWGDPELHPRAKTNQYIVEDDVLKIITSAGETILADAEDKEKLSKYSWCISKTGYAVANINHKVTKLHRYLLNLEDPKVVADHMNHNVLDNRKSNLRICTQAQNALNQRSNKSKISTGIRLTPSGKYKATIQPKGKSVCLGTYATLEEAIAARNAAELKYFGEYAQHLYR